MGPLLTWYGYTKTFPRLADLQSVCVCIYIYRGITTCWWVSDCMMGCEYTRACMHVCVYSVRRCHVTIHEPNHVRFRYTRVRDTYIRAKTHVQEYWYEIHVYMHTYTCIYTHSLYSNCHTKSLHIMHRIIFCALCAHKYMIIIPRRHLCT